MGNIINPPITARFIRVHPITWHAHISMRLELYGCKGTTSSPCARHFSSPPPAHGIFLPPAHGISSFLSLKMGHSHSFSQGEGRLDFQDNSVAGILQTCHSWENSFPQICSANPSDWASSRAHFGLTPLPSSSVLFDISFATLISVWLLFRHPYSTLTSDILICDLNQGGLSGLAQHSNNLENKIAAITVYGPYETKCFRVARGPESGRWLEWLGTVGQVLAGLWVRSEIAPAHLHQPAPSEWREGLLPVGRPGRRVHHLWISVQLRWGNSERVAHRAH